jgi:hypothetical protein
MVEKNIKFRKVNDKKRKREQLSLLPPKLFFPRKKEKPLSV